MIAAPEWLARLAEPWATFYSDHGTLRTVIVTLHVLPLLLGGGAAVSADRATLRAGRLGMDEDRVRQLTALGTTHRLVTVSLAAVTISGVALLLADLEQFFGSWIFWTKMGLVVALLVNGGAMLRNEGMLRAQAGDGTWNEVGWRAWRRLEGAARLSLGLWVVITVLGVALVNLE
jgi:uncharacterized membrane protein